MKIIISVIFEYDKKDINQHLGGLAPDDLNITDSNTLMQIGGEINKFYFDGRKIEKQSTAKELGKVYVILLMVEYEDNIEDFAKNKVFLIFYLHAAIDRYVSYLWNKFLDDYHGV